MLKRQNNWVLSSFVASFFPLRFYFDWLDSVNQFKNVFGLIVKFIITFLSYLLMIFPCL